MQLLTASGTVYRWISDSLSGKSRLRTRAASEMLMQRRIGLVTSLVDECGLQVQVSLVPSASNKADSLTRVPQRWIRTTAIPAVVCMAMDSRNIDDEVKRIHDSVGYPGVRRTLYVLCETCQHCSYQAAGAVSRQELSRVPVY